MVGSLKTGCLCAAQNTLETFMEDVLWIAVTIAFFALSIGYVRFCERIK
jgi:hypothetical protein